MNILDRVKTLLENPKLIYLLIFLAFVLHLPSLSGGWHLDDLIQREMLLEQKGAFMPALMDIYIYQNSEVTPHVQQTFPWWTHPKLYVGFWRPMTSVTQWVDYKLWPSSSRLMHLNNIFWFLIAVFFVSLIYRKTSSALWIAGLAALIFTIDDIHTTVVGWLSSRNVVTAIAFGAASILSHIYWRERKKLHFLIISLLCLALSVLSAEAGIATFAYIAAFALILDKASLKNKAMSIAPAFAVIFFWRYTYKKLGFEALHSGIYTDPLGDPATFWKGVAENIPIFLQSSLTEPSIVTSSAASPKMLLIIWLASLVFVIAVIAILSKPLFQKPVLVFWLLGAIFCLVPASAGVLGSARLLIFASVGAAGFVAEVIALGVQKPRKRLSKWLITALACLFILSHLLVPSLRQMKKLATSNPLRQTQELFPGPKIEEQPNAENIYILNHPSSFFSMYLPYYRRLVGDDMQQTVETIASGYSPISISRISENTIEIEAIDGFAPCEITTDANHPNFHPAYFAQKIGVGFRSCNDRLAAGEIIEQDNFSIEILESANAKDEKAKFTFKKPVDDEKVVWLRWDWNVKAFSPMEMPEIGQTVTLEGAF